MRAPAHRDHTERPIAIPRFAPSRLGALNARVAELVADLNARTMRTYKTSRRELFERLDKPALMPLPAVPFESCLWKKVGLNIDYHVAFEDHFYSAPHTLRTDDVKLWLRATTSLEIFHVSERVAIHVRNFVRGGFTTITDHMPSSHRAHAEWTPTRILGWAEPGDIKAIAYDEESQRILIVDDGVVTEPIHPRKHGRHGLLDKVHLPFHFEHSRLVLIDLRAQTITEVAKIKRSDHFSRVSLVHKGGGEYVLARGSKNGKWFTFRDTSSTWREAKFHPAGGSAA